jgi:drug/metabolite transporter (DMT)-like permease
MIDPNGKSFWRPNSGKTNVKYKTFLFISILLGSAGQILMKHGVESLGGISFAGAPFETLFHIFTSPCIIAGLCCNATSMLFWLTVISKLELSFAYPMVALSYILILIYSIAVFNEKAGAIRIAGIASIMIGVILISRTDNKKGGG